MDNWIALGSAFMIGFVGSLHCVGMCGPIALALPLGQKKAFQKIVGIGLYNFGRIITYSLLGAIFGLIGKGFSIVGLQQNLSIAIGVVMLLSVFLKGTFEANFGVLNRLVNFIKIRLSRFFKTPTLLNLSYIGLFNGLLPCGLVYVAIFGSLLSDSITHAILYMIAFGLGTVPLMFVTSVVGSWTTASIKHKINKVIPIIIVLIAILFILRGLGLEIPYISPPTEALSPVNTEAKCH